MSGPVNLVTLEILAAYRPLVGASRRSPHIRHAVPLDSIAALASKWPNCRTVTAACGQQVAIISPLHWWAPTIRGTNLTRCPDCAATHGTRVPRIPKWAQTKAAT